jgi:hypothetical protein
MSWKKWATGFATSQKHASGCEAKDYDRGVFKTAHIANLFCTDCLTEAPSLME